MKKYSITNSFFHMGLTAEQYRLVRPKIAERNRKNLKTMSLVMAAFALVMLSMEFLVLHQNFQWLYGAVFFAGLITHFLSRVAKKNDHHPCFGLCGAVFPVFLCHCAHRFPR